MPIDELSPATERPEVAAVILGGQLRAPRVLVYGFVHHDENPVGPQNPQSLRESRSDLRKVMKRGVAYRDVQGT